MDNIKCTHTFKVGDQDMEILITRYNGFWQAKVIRGESGIGTMSGGTYENLEVYKKHVEREHTYGYNFFKHGYKHAKRMLINNPI